MPDQTLEAYCFTCKDKTGVVNVQQKQTKPYRFGNVDKDGNVIRTEGKRRLYFRGSCEKCGKSVTVYPKNVKASDFDTDSDEECEIELL
jgi:hypothetical protein